MSLVGKKVSDFKVKAFHNGEFIDVTSDDIKGKWSVFVFYPRTSPSSARPSWQTLRTSTISLRR